MGMFQCHLIELKTPYVHAYVSALIILNLCIQAINWAKPNIFPYHSKNLTSNGNHNPNKRRKIEKGRK